MTLAECIVRTVFDVDEQSQSKVKGSINKLAGFAKKALGVIGIGFSIKGISELAEAAAGVEALVSQFTQTFGEMEEDATNALDKIADNTGISVNRMKGSFVQIAAFAKTTGMDEAESLEIADRAMQAVADSAAFYDREIEQVTNTMQSFLKGNYANDAALGLSCTETTRNAAANTLYAKSFNELSEAEKQLTLLYMVENANELSGALGQAARESDTWTNQLGNLKQGLTDLKASAGAFVVKPMTDAVKALSEVLRIATRWVQSLNGENNALARGYEKVSTTVKNVVNRFGGLETVMKLMITLAVALGVALTWSKVAGSIKNITTIIQTMGKTLGATNLKMIAMIAVIALIILAIEDFYHFMKGDNSVIGAVFEKAGIDADAARERVVAAWNTIKETLLYVWDVLRQTGGEIAEVIGQFWADSGEEILTFVSYAVTSIIEMVGHLLAAVVSFIGFIAALVSGDWATAWEYAYQFFMEIGKAILAWFENLPDDIKESIKAVVASIKNGLQEGIDWLKSLPDQARQWGADFINGLKAGIDETVSGVVDSVKGFASNIASLIHFSRPDEGPLRDYESWMPDFMAGLAEGIRNGKSAVVDAAKQMSSEVAAEAKIEYPDDIPEPDIPEPQPTPGAAGMSVSTVKPDAGKPSAADTPTVPYRIGQAVGTAKEYASEIASGIQTGLQKVAKNISGTTGKEGIPDMSDIVSGVQQAVTGISKIAEKAVASPQAAYSSVSTSNRSIVQNINISNSYSGDRDVQKTASKAMNKSAGDATAQLANALKYA